MAILKATNTLRGCEPTKTNETSGAVDVTIERAVRAAPVAVKPRRSRTNSMSVGSVGDQLAGKNTNPLKQKAKRKDRTNVVDTAKTNKTEQVLKKLRSLKGVTIEVLMEATGWQAHSVRGFLSAVVKKKLGLNLVSEVGKDGTRRYRVKGEARGE